MQKKNGKAIFGEFLGSAFLSFWGLGLAIPFAVTGDVSDISEFAIWFGIAFIITAMAFTPISGAHLNPGVSIAWAIFGDFKWKLVPAYIIAQIAGWCAGVVPVYVIYCNRLTEWAATTGGNPATIFHCTSPTGYVVSGAGLEIAMTMLLTFAIFLLLDERLPNRPSGKAFPVIIGAIISLDIAFGGGYSGACINTARDLGPRIAGYIYGITHGYDVSSLFGDTQWLMYIVAPCLGAILGGVLHFGIIRRLLPDPKEIQ
ncbi:MAG: MIP/aquaporin family protein [Christensenellales bacterium]|nr:MIP/aquaporin family protein [Christensenellales bacterium]